tara:strand:+ start:2822 stop:3934 length:1113 start_codon:yes stop_codon:yes gene_type:complete
MKILIVIDSIGTGGAQKLKAELAQGLSRKGNQVEIFIYNDNNDKFFASDLTSSGVKIHVAKKNRNGFSISVLYELRRLLKKDYDVIISSMHAPSIYAALAKLGIRKSKLIVCDESSSNAPVPFIKRYLFYIATIISDLVVPNSFNEALLMKKLPGRSNKIHPIWNGYDLSSFNFDDKEIYTNKGIKKLLIVGRIAYPKNGLNLLKALSLFLNSNGWLPEVNWVGRDDFDKRSTDMKEQMNNYLINNPDISKKFNWLGVVDDVQDFYKSSDALMHVSIYEGLPNVICEAMLSGCFVIASNVCDHPLVLGDSERGILCDPLSPESICNAIEMFNGMEEAAKIAIIKKARNFAELEFNRDTMTDKYLALINER